ncbi:MAG: hypothetical protein L0210_07330 [Rhodospirillales bacterium]|nr:hypothetical protein [Rhodospirillales bacterium]
MKVTFLPRSLRLGRLARSLLMGVATALCGLGLALTPLGTEFERAFGLDWLFNMRGATKPPADVVVFAIDSNGRVACSGGMCHNPKIVAQLDRSEDANRHGERDARTPGAAG